MVVTQLFSKSVKNSLRNGPLFNENITDFTDFIKGGVLQKFQIELLVEVGWFVDLEGTQVNLVKDASDSQKGYLYTPSVNWISEGFSPGDFISARIITGNIFFTATIQSIDGNYCYISTPSISGFPDTSASDEWGQVKGLTDLLNVDFGFGFVDSNGSFSVNNQFTNTAQRLFATDVSTLVTAQPYDQINKAWQTGSVKIELVGPVQDRDLYTPGNTFNRYRIIQEVIFTNFYRDGELNNLKNKLPPARFAGDKTLKHVFETKFKDSVYNPNQEKTFRNQVEKSSLGWFGESSNGFQNNFTISDVSYSDLLTNQIETIQADEITRVNLNVNSLLDVFTSFARFEIGHIKLLEESEYSNSKMTWDNLWMYDNLRQSSSLPSSSSSIVKNCIATVQNTSQTSIQFDVEFSAEQKNRIENGDNFLLFLIIENKDLNSNNSDIVTLIIDVNQYAINTDIEGLIDLNNISFYRNQNEFNPLVESGFTDLKIWNETAFMCDFKLELNTDKNPVFSLLSAVLCAYNESTGDLFDIEEYGFNLNSVDVNGVEQINIQDTRSYNLIDESPFNFVNFKNDGSGMSSEFYRGQIGVKTNWQSWIENEKVNNIFYNTSEDFNGKNKKTSNYSLKEGYKIRFMIRVVLSVDDLNTTYNLSSPDFDVQDYEIEHDNKTNWISTSIDTFNSDSANVEGYILSNENTLIVCTAVPSSPIADIAEYWGVIRVEEERQNGFGIDELDTINDYPDNNRLIPLQGETRAKLSIESGNLKLKGMFDVSKFKQNANYSLSFEIDRKEQVVPPGAYSSAYNKNAYN